MEEYFIRKLRRRSRLLPDDVAALLASRQNIQLVGPRRDILHEGDRPRGIPLVLDGWAYSYSQLENGKRQLLSLFVPGDICEPFGVLPRFVTQSLATFTNVRLATVPISVFRDAARSFPNIADALWWDLLVSGAIDRERIVSLGRRTAVERLGHLLCELHLRLDVVGMARDDGYNLPLTQAELADVLGLTPVHLNRSLQQLRATGMVSLAAHRVTFHDIDGLRSASFFDPAYLHLTSMA